MFLAGFEFAIGVVFAIVALYVFVLIIWAVVEGAAETQQRKSKERQRKNEERQRKREEREIEVQQLRSISWRKLNWRQRVRRVVLDHF